MVVLLDKLERQKDKIIDYYSRHFIYQTGIHLSYYHDADKNLIVATPWENRYHAVTN